MANDLSMTPKIILVIALLSYSGKCQSQENEPAETSAPVVRRLSEEVAELKEGVAELKESIKLLLREHVQASNANFTEVKASLTDLKTALTDKVDELAQNLQSSFTSLNNSFTSVQANVLQELHLLRNMTELQTQDDHQILQTSTALIDRGSITTSTVPQAITQLAKTLNKFNPCAEIESRSKSDITPSGHYWVQNAAGAAVHVYCNMNRSCCGYTGGWMRVGYLNMTNTSHTCPAGFKLHTAPRRCGLSIRRSIGSRSIKYVYDNFGCSSVTYPSQGIQYQRVCGKIKAYQKGTTDAFYNYHSASSPITSHYVDGVSITHGTYKHHIWTFAAANDGLRADQWRCPCSRNDRTFDGHVPPYVGNDYFCDTGSPIFPNPQTVYTEDPLWDGSGCGPTSSCCTFNSPPWFCKELPQPTTDSIELRVCRDQLDGDEDIQIQLVEIYIG